MKRTKDTGFTLIELIVVIAIIILLSGVSLATYFRFSQRQAAMNDARNFATMLRRVQAMAKNLVYPTEACTGLQGYRLKTSCPLYNVEECQIVRAYAVCNEGEREVIHDEKVLEKAFFSDEVSIMFQVGSGAILTQIEFPITNSADDYTVVVSTDTIGNVSIKEYETYE